MSRIASDRVPPTRTGYLSQRATGRNLRAHLDTLLPALPSGSRILDLGCGNKPYAPLFAGHQHIGLNIDAIDATPDVVGDGQLLPFRDGAFSLCVCSQVLEHVPEPQALCSEVGRTLRPGGHFLLSAPFYWPLHEEPFDFWRFTPHGLRHLLRKAGFEVLSLEADGHAISLTATSLNHLFPGPLFAPVRLALNVTGRILDGLHPVRHSSPNYTVLARKAA